MEAKRAQLGVMAGQAWRLRGPDWALRLARHDRQNGYNRHDGRLARYVRFVPSCLLYPLVSIAVLGFKAFPFWALGASRVGF